MGPPGCLAEPSPLQSAPATATAEGTIIGTLQYVAPEQIQGHKLDARFTDKDIADLSDQPARSGDSGRRLAVLAISSPAAYIIPARRAAGALPITALRND